MNMQTVIYIAIMAGVTYLIRMLPIMVFRRKIKSQVVQSFLYYVPYAVAMTIPAVFYSTGSMAASAAGFAAAFAAAFFGRSLITVALAASAAAYAVMLIF